MARLSRADMEAALAFAAEVSSLAPEPRRADEWMLERVAHMTGSEVAAYDLFDATSTWLVTTETPGPAWVPTEQEWTLLRSENPFSAHAMRQGRRTFGAVRLSDVADMRTFRESALYAALDGPSDYVIQARMPADDGGHWTIELARSQRDYSLRDLLLVDAIRPALVNYEAHRALAAKVAALQGMLRQATPDKLLSARENEVLDLVASGATNAQIAERLWISPATVKKHLENVYVKLGVGGRTAALAITGRSHAANGGGGTPRH